MFIRSVTYICRCMRLLFNALINEPVDFVSICSKYIVFATGKVCVNLSRKERVLGDICSSRVLVERQNKKPRDPNHNKQGRQVRWDFEDARVPAKREDRSFTCQYFPSSLSRLLT
jgi:hypothetical protein